MQSNPVAAIACAVIDHHIHGRAGQRRANRRKNLALDEALVGKHGHPLQAQLGGLRAGFGKNTGADRFLPAGRNRRGSSARESFERQREVARIIAKSDARGAVRKL